MFEQRTAKALSKLGVPTAKDVDALVKRVDALTAQVAKLNGAKPAAKATRARPAAKKATAPKVKAAAKRSTGTRAARKQAAA
jgi:hypothetical protein